jgi:hypothetical protein
LDLVWHNWYLAMGGLEEDDELLDCLRDQGGTVPYESSGGGIFVVAV